MTDPFRPCPDPELCIKGDACAGRCSQPQEAAAFANMAAREIYEFLGRQPPEARTGRIPEMLQDDCRALSIALSKTPGARLNAKEAAAEISTCPNPQHMGKFACNNRHQCWEPCGELGHSLEHARPAEDNTPTTPFKEPT